MPAATRDEAFGPADQDSGPDLTFADLLTEVAGWVTTVTGRATVVGAAARTSAPDDESIVLHPYTIQPTERPQPRDAAEATARVLVFAAADDVAAAHAVTTLALTAMTQAERDVDLTPTTDQTWLALGLSPRPSFAIAGRVRMHVDRPAVARVLHPLNLRTGRLRVLSGDVRSVDGIALTPASVRLVPHGPSTQVGPDGRWSLPVPASLPATLDVHTKGIRVRRLVAPEDADIHVVVDLGLDPPSTPEPSPTDPSTAGKD